MVDAIVSYAINKLDVFLIKEVNIRIGVKNAVNRLKNDLSFLHVYVRVLEEKQQTGHVRLWIDSVNDVANEAVIILERFSTHEKEHGAPRQGVLDHIRCCVCMCKKEVDLYDIGKEIESLEERFDGIKKRQEDYKINDIVASLSQNQNHQARRIKNLIPFENEVDVVGFENDAKKLLAELVEKDPDLRVISIHGMGGLGKTTLARKLYDSRELSHFQHRSFVCVSKDFEIKDVLRSIIKSFMGPKYEVDLLNMMNEVDLLEHLRNLLDGDRYLAVVDDIWDVKDWKLIEKAFPQNKKGGRVIITTRNKEVAQGVGYFVHPLSFLTEEESWNLFFKRAKPNRNLEKLGQEMVKKCRRLPLAIVVLSGLLLHKSYDEWSELNNHLWRRLQNNSSEIQEILDLSYEDLSPQMKQCFLYLARYSEDCIFEVDQLKLLWIAEEFIPEDEEVVMEDVAKDCLNELINRNMIQIAELKMNGEVKECKVHDLVRDLSIQKAKERKLLGTFDSSKQHTNSNSISFLQGQTRHTIYNGLSEYMKFLKPSSVDSKLRTLAVVSKIEIPFEIEEMKLVYTRFIYLKVLDLSIVKSHEIPSEIGDLVLLKFLGLNQSGYGMNLVIPATISKLKRLQTLYGKGGRYEFPTKMRELIELRHLILPSTSGRMHIGSQQTKLHTVKGIKIEEWMQIDSTVNFTNLRKLFIQGNEENAACSLDSIANLINLQTLALRFRYNAIPTIKPISSCKHLKTVWLQGQIEDMSELSLLPDAVTFLSLSYSRFEQDPMQILGTLSNLTSFHMFNAFNGRGMVCNHDAFPNLEFLRVEKFSSFEEFQAEDGALPSLKGLSIKFCSRLEIISPQLKRVPAIPDIYCEFGFGLYGLVDTRLICSIFLNNLFRPHLFQSETHFLFLEHILVCRVLIRSISLLF